MAFATTQKRSTAKVQRDVEDLGARVSARTSREVFSYSGEVLRDNVEGLVSVLSEVTTQPKLWYWEVTEAKHALEGLIASQAADPKAAVLEGLHAAAYGSTTPFGRSVYASASDLEDVNDATIRSFLGSRFNAANAVIVANSTWPRLTPENAPANMHPCLAFTYNPHPVTHHSVIPIPSLPCRRQARHLP